jgi:uncharacterized protein YecT (DUF1311 family)
MRGLVLALAMILPAPVAAQELGFSPAATEACLASTEDQNEYRFCVGRSAGQCMSDNPGGETTVGMSGCLDREWEYWDRRLNAAYQTLLGSAKRSDQVMVDLGSSVGAQQEPALRAMQRAWIGFRDAACEYEYSLWGGGTGGRPAITQCLMLETGWQALRIEARLAQFDKDG